MNKKSLKDEIIELIKKDYSIPKISKKLNISRSTIYYHYKKIKGKKYIQITIPKDDSILGEFLGIFSGDGSFYYDKKYWHYTMTIKLHAIDDRIYSEYVTRLIEKNFNKKVRTYQKENALTLAFYSKDIFNIINKYLNIYPRKTYDIYIKDSLDKLSNEFLLSFTRGLIDTDGHSKKDGRIVLCLASKKMVYQVSSILNKFDIKNKIYIRNGKVLHYEMIVPRKEVIKYLRLIGFSNKRKEINALAEIRNPDLY